MSDADKDKKSAATEPEAANEDIASPAEETAAAESGEDVTEDAAERATANDATDDQEAPTEPDASVDESEEEEEAEEEIPPTPEEEIAQLKDQLLRAMAETENTRRRGQREIEDARKFAISEFARDLLGLTDNLTRALESARDDNGDNGDAAAQGALLEGVELTQRQFLQALENYGIQPIEAEGQKLDPNLHQAMLQIDDDEVEPGTIVQVIQIGYTIHDRLLRPALVAVAKATETEVPAETGQHIDTEA